MIRPGNELLTDRHRAAARWLPTTVLKNKKAFWPWKTVSLKNSFSHLLLFVFFIFSIFLLRSDNEVSNIRFCFSDLHVYFEIQKYCYRNLGLLVLLWSIKK